MQLVPLLSVFVELDAYLQLIRKDWSLQVAYEETLKFLKDYQMQNNPYFPILPSADCFHHSKSVRFILSF